MMYVVDAMYQNGVFKPLKEVGLPENQRVRLSVEPATVADAAAWLADVRELRQRIVSERGYFPDSTADIAEDRRR